MKNILILGYHKFPEGDARSVRLECFAKILKELNNDVVVVGLGDYTSFNYKTKDDIKYISLRGKGSNFFSKAFNYLFYLTRLKKYVLSQIDKFDCIILGITDKKIINFSKRYAKKFKAKVILDAVEWYSKEQFKFGGFAKAYRDNNKMNTVWIDKSISVISISKYLHSYFSSRGINSIRIPVIVDVDAIKCDKEILNDKVVISYAGMPGKKDYFIEVLKGLLLLSDKELKKIELRIMGATLDALKENVQLLDCEWDRLSNTFNCLGRISRNEVLKNLSQSDFTILIRSDTQRYAKAGFPTKVPESLSTGTPIICNFTSDLKDYLVDGYNCFEVKSLDVTSLLEVYKKIINLNIEEKEVLFNNARRTAEKYFDYKNYISQVNEII